MDTNNNLVSVGEIFATDYYGMPFAFKVIKTTAKTATAKNLKLQVISSDGYGQNGYCVPVADQFDNRRMYDELTFRIHDREGETILINRKEDVRLHKYTEGRKLHFYTD